MKIIDVHGAHVLDFERFHLNNNEMEESKNLGYSVLDCVKDMEIFLLKNKDNFTTILPPPSSIFNSMERGGKFDFDIFPFHYENSQLLQVITFLSKKDLEQRVLPYFGFSPIGDSQEYKNYLEELTNKVNCGLKFHPLAMQIPISKLENSFILKLANKKSLPLLIHTGGDEYSDSRMLIEIAKNNKEINFCAAHFGYFRRLFLEEISSIPNLFLDTSILSSLLNDIETENPKHVDLESIPSKVRKYPRREIFNWIIGKYNLEDKILFGSDIKWTYHVNSNRKKEIELVKNLNYSEDKKDKWLYQNARRFLRL